MLIIRHPLTVEATELRYVLDILLTRFLSLDYRLETGESDQYEVRVRGESGRFFLPSAVALGRHSVDVHRQVADTENEFSLHQLPQELLSSRLSSKFMPGLASKRIRPVTVPRDEMHIPFDIFGLSFFLLSRAEEKVADKLDSHQRFSSTHSFAASHGFLDRPLVDEYVEVLAATIRLTWPRLRFPPKVLRHCVTVDIDRLYKPSKWGSRRFGSVITSLLEPVQVSLSGLRLRQGWFDSDVFFTSLKRLLDINEAAGNVVTAYFPLGGRSRFDPPFSIREKIMLDSARMIVDRGHELGAHPGYDAPGDAREMRKQLLQFEIFLKRAGCSHMAVNVRQHYLRWFPAVTPLVLDEFGVSSDSTLGFADRPGFRCSTSRDYPLYDWKNRKAHSFLERPLILMEASVMSTIYMGLGASDDALSIMENLRDVALRTSGQFTMLWHNHYFDGEKSWEMYERLVRLS